jgi:hypothetical protein
MRGGIPIVAREGEYAGCPSGHRLYRVAAHILPGARIRSTQFSPVSADVPANAPHTRVMTTPCPFCGAAWIRPKVWPSGRVEGFEVHFEEGGWR